MTPATASKLAQLAEPLRSRIAALLARTGEAVWIVSGRRSLEEQAQLRRAHCGTSFYDVWQKPANQCSPPTAIPGRSKHNQGLAVDLGGDTALAERLAGQLGLVSPVRGEDWHFEVDPAAAGLAGFGVPPVISDPIGTGVDVITGGVGDAVADVLGGLVDPLVSGLKRIALVSVLVAGGVTLAVLGGQRSFQAPLVKELTG
jgi:D-alanyl-D-alanine carboxypeptidase